MKRLLLFSGILALSSVLWAAASSAGEGQDLSALRAELARSEPARRRAAMEALEQLGAQAAPLASEVILGLRDSDVVVRRHAAGLLVELRCPAAIPGLEDGAADADDLFGVLCADALGALGPRAARSADVLIEVVLHHARREERIESYLVALNRLGPRALRRVSEDLSSLLAVERQRILSAPPRQGCFGDANLWPQSAARGLALAGELAPLKRLFDYPLPEIRRIAVEGVAPLGSAARAVLPALLRAAEHDPEPEVRAEALESLTAVAEPTPRLVRSLARILGDADADEGLRISAARGLGRAGAAAPEPAVKALIHAVESYGHEVLYEALAALERLGPLAKAAIPALEELPRLGFKQAERTLRAIRAPSGPSSARD